MKRLLLVVLTFLVVLSGVSYACVGKLLYIGALGSAQEQIFAEMLSVMINERTGTTVNVKYYGSPKDLYNAVKKKEINILLDNTDSSMAILGKGREENPKRAYDISKGEFKKTLNLIWLEPLTPLPGGSGKGRPAYVPVVTGDVLNNFPALPRVINKLGGVINEDAYTKLMHSFRAGEKPKKTARDFLKSKKLI